MVLNPRDSLTEDWSGPMINGPFLAVFAALVLAGQVGVAPAQPPATATTSPSVGAATPVKVAHNSLDPDQVICRVEPRPGSRIGGNKLCLTRARWEAVARQSAATLTAIQMENDHAPSP
jgi:hypothetical protein